MSKELKNLKLRRWQKASLRFLEKVPSYTKYKKTLEETSYQSAVETARKLTDTTFIDNVQNKAKRPKRPVGYSFEAI